MILKEVLEKSISFLKAKNVDPAKLDSELLISDSLKMKRLDLYLQYERPLSEEEVLLCRERIVRRSKGEPVSIILGRRDFCGFIFHVNQHVLTPRFETEELVEKAVDIFLKSQKSESVIFDLGAGSGCIGISVLRLLDQKQKKSQTPIALPVKVVAVEKSEKALQVLQMNVQELLGADTSKRYIAFQGDCAHPELYMNRLSQQERDSVTMILGNPPYIADHSPDVAADVLAHEPKEALFGGPVGTEASKAWTQSHLSFLQPGGCFLFEIGFDQGPSMTRIFQELGLHDVQVFKDMSGLDRMIYGRK